MKLTAQLLAVAVLLAGCATSRTITGQDGRPIHKISCDGSVLDMGACYEKAGELCGSAGFEVVNESGSARPFMYAGPESFVSGAAVYRTLLARCR